MASRICLFVVCSTLIANTSWAIQKRMKDDPMQPDYANASRTPSWGLQGKPMDDPPNGSADLANSIANYTPSDSAERANDTANYSPLGNETNGEAAQLDKVADDDGSTYASFPNGSDSEDDGKVQIEHFEEEKEKWKEKDKDKDNEKEKYDDGSTYVFPNRSYSEDDGKVQLKHFEESNMTIWGTEWQSNGKFPRIGIGINCPKCGSSFFYQVIGRHPQIRTGVKKETKYFSADQSHNVCPQLADGAKATTHMQKYVSRCFGKNSNGDLQNPWNTTEYGTLFEFTPDYLLDAVENPEVLQPLANVYRDADVRFIALLYDPVLRVTSELNMWRESQAIWKGKTDAEMSAAVPGLLAEGKEVIRLGHYAENLEGFRKTFAKDRILIVNHDSLDEKKTWQNVFMFLGLEAFTDAGDTTIKNMLKDAHQHEDSVTHSKKGYLQLSQEAVNLLKNHYAEHDQKLWKLLEVKEPWW